MEGRFVLLLALFSLVCPLLGDSHAAFEKVLRDIIHTGVDFRSQVSQRLTLEVDPFNALDTRTYKMRFWADESYWDGEVSAPVFLSMGGEGAAGPPGGQMLELAKQHKGIAFSIEHRYYGESIPTVDFSTANLQWLSARLALADAAFFQEAMVSRYNLSSTSRWIAVGGSYSGELAAWARLKYPHLFWGALASSAPVTAAVDYSGYDLIVASALRRQDLGGSAACYNAVRDAFMVLEQYFDTNRSELQGIFGTCGPVVDAGDCFLLHDYVSDDWMGLVQYNQDVPGATNIRLRCAQMLDSKYGATVFDRLVNITRQRAKSSVCIFDIDPSGVTDSISFEKHLRGYANASNIQRSFPYQMCVDGVGHDQTCKPDLGCIFSPKYADRSFFQQQCVAAFGASEDITNSAVRTISTEFGDEHLATSRIVFINGDIDPFHYGSVTQNTTSQLARDIVAFWVVGGSHCQDMSRTSDQDTPSMQAAKRGKAALVTKWLAQDFLPVLMV